MSQHPQPGPTIHGPQINIAGTEEGCVCHSARAAPRAPHPLPEGTNGIRRFGLQHPIWIANIDPQFEGRGTHNAGGANWL